jgi:hypothetical protein
MIYRLILPDWAAAVPGFDPRRTPRVIEAELDDEQLVGLNQAGYNCYWLPNYPSQYNPDKKIDGTDIDTFEFVYVDMDLKEGKYPDKDSFLSALGDFPLQPSLIVDSGNGVHAYWRVLDLDAMSFLRLQRRLARHLNTDLAVAKIYQLMRVWGTMNTKKQDEFKPCEALLNSGLEYTAEQLDKALPKISAEDEVYCKQHYDKTYGLSEKVDVADELPAKWFKRFPKGSEGHTLFYTNVKDRSAADYRLGHLLYAAGCTKDEALAVLTRTGKASERVGVHRYNYAAGIVEKIWVDPVERDPETKGKLALSVRDLLGDADNEELTGQRFPCNEIVDKTACGFRLTHVLGLVAGAGAGKTTWALNLFHWFAERNPQYIHVFVSLEQPAREIAKRWRVISEGNAEFLDKVQVIGNYNDDGTYRNLSLQEIEDEIKDIEKRSGQKVGCVVIDHIGVLKQATKDGEFQGLIDICKYMKAFAVNTNTFLVMQSQAPREKAGIGDIELDKDAAYGTSQFEWYVDWLVTSWQPLKRVYDEAPHMTVTCFKYCKIRHKNTKADAIKEDVPYAVMFDPDTERLRRLNADEQKGYDFFAKKATNLRNRDKRRDPRGVSDVTWVATPKQKGLKDGKPNPDPQRRGA